MALGLCHGLRILIYAHLHCTSPSIPSSVPPSVRAAAEGWEVQVRVVRAGVTTSTVAVPIVPQDAGDTSTPAAAPAPLSDTADPVDTPRAVHPEWDGFTRVYCSLSLVAWAVATLLLMGFLLHANSSSGSDLEYGVYSLYMQGYFLWDPGHFLRALYPAAHAGIVLQALVGRVHRAIVSSQLCIYAAIPPTLTHSPSLSLVCCS